MNTTTALWIPQDKNLTQDEKMVLAQPSPRQLPLKRESLVASMEGKLRVLMDKEDDPMLTLEIVPDLYLAALPVDSNQARAAAILLDSSLSDLVYRVDLEAPWERLKQPLGVAQPQTLESLLASLATSLA